MARWGDAGGCPGFLPSAAANRASLHSGALRLRQAFGDRAWMVAVDGGGHGV
ncbi:hypothetical protein [Nocardia sp. NPDC046763]|uniref:hypothetical protein n=1 Tax=Nocardia sp. NPDC046763 TaxID=3155256 RepID=UPI0033DC2DD9